MAFSLKRITVAVACITGLLIAMLLVNWAIVRPAVESEKVLVSASGKPLVCLIRSYPNGGRSIFSQDGRLYGFEIRDRGVLIAASAVRFDSFEAKRTDIEAGADGRIHFRLDSYDIACTVHYWSQVEWTTPF